MFKLKQEFKVKTQFLRTVIEGRAITIESVMLLNLKELCFFIRLLKGAISF